MEINPLTAEDVERWIDMRHLLSPYYSRQELSTEVERWESGRTGVFVATDDADAIGFSEVSMHDQAPGCTTSPVGYHEGWWVAEGHRRQGVGRALLEAAEGWARRRGASEMGSDAHADNTVSRSAHAAVGFTEKRPVARFYKSIGTALPVTVTAVAEVSLREIDSANVRAVTALDVAPHQQVFVAPNAVSMAEYAVTTRAWTRAIYADEELVGYVLLSDDGEQPRYYLWRFMIDERYQGLGFGKRAMDLVIDYVRALPGADGLYLSYAPAEGGPGGFLQATRLRRHRQGKGRGGRGPSGFLARSRCRSPRRTCLDAH